MLTTNAMRPERNPVHDEPAAAAVTGQSVDSQLINAILCEIASSSLLAAITTGFLTSRINTGRRIPFDIALRTVPQDPMIFPAARYASEDAIGSNLLHRCAEYYRYLRASRELLMQLREKSVAGRRIESADNEKLGDLWQATCATALLALYEIDSTQESLTVAGGRDHFNLICDALIAARDGKSPYLDRDIPRLPEWAERRQITRRIVNAPGFITVNRRKSPVMVTNASRRGFGLDFVTDARTGDVISVELSGRKFVATVIWREGARAGAKLRKPLSPLDPLLSA